MSVIWRLLFFVFYLFGFFWGGLFDLLMGYIPFYPYECEDNFLCCCALYLC